MCGSSLADSRCSAARLRSASVVVLSPLGALAVAVGRAFAAPGEDGFVVAGGAASAVPASSSSCVVAGAGAAMAAAGAGALALEASLRLCRNSSAKRGGGAGGEINLSGGVGAASTIGVPTSAAGPLPRGAFALAFSGSRLTGRPGPAR